MTYIAVQFWFITKDVYVNNWIALILAVASFIMVSIFMPESPRYLFSSKRFKEAKQVIRQIATINGTNNNFGDSFMFAAELDEDSNNKADIQQDQSRTPSE